VFTEFSCSAGVGVDSKPRQTAYSGNCIRCQAKNIGKYEKLAPRSGGLRLRGATVGAFAPDRAIF
jgi:hypothetical protein